MAMQQAVQLQRRPFTVYEYDRIVEAGIVREDERVELIAGEIVCMTAMGKRHAGCLRQLDSLLHQPIGDVAVISVQMPVSIPDFDEPEPDIAVLRRRDDLYRAGHPTPADVLLIIEVLDTTLAYDRGVKLPIYARAGIPEVWLVDLPDQAIERYADPSEGAYRLVTRAGRGERLASVTVPSLEVDVDTVLG